MQSSRGTVPGCSAVQHRSFNVGLYAIVAAVWRPEIAIIRTHRYWGGALCLPKKTTPQKREKRRRTQMALSPLPVQCRCRPLHEPSAVCWASVVGRRGAPGKVSLKTPQRGQKQKRTPVRKNLPRSGVLLRCPNDWTLSMESLSSDTLQGQRSARRTDLRSFALGNYDLPKAIVSPCPAGHRLLG